jgi:lipopolysaccharide transport system ATP-binding protein
MSNAAILCEGLGKRFSRADIVPYQGLRSKLSSAFGGAKPAAGVVWALRDVSFEVPAGKIVGVLGGNGCGKSVLMKLLARITKASEGRCEVRGSLSSILNLGAMLNPELTGRENVFEVGTVLRLPRPKVQKHFDEIVAFSGIEEHLDALVRGYSAGMQLRLAFAVMAHLESDVLLIDEALSVADQDFRALCTARIREMSRAGSTIMIVSHELDTMAELCDLALVVDHGRLREYGNAAGVLERYRRETHTPARAER